MIFLHVQWCACVSCVLKLGRLQSKQFGCLPMCELYNFQYEGKTTHPGTLVLGGGCACIKRTIGDALLLWPEVQRSSSK